MPRIIFYIILCLFPWRLYAGHISYSELERFISIMDSQKIEFTQRPGQYNHYYKSKKDWPTAIVFLPGMGESALKYYDLALDLNHLPATLYIWDHTGQGFSSHLLPDEIAKIYIDSFETYILSLENLLFKLHSTHKNIYVIGHSMGGHLALRFIIKHPNIVDKLALSAPLIDLNKETIPIHLVSWLLDYLPGKYYPPFYFLFQNSHRDGSYVTKSDERLRVLDEMYKKYPQLKRESTTIGWLRAALSSVDILQKSDFSKTATPTLILQAETDYLVSSQAQNDLCKKMINCQLQVVPGSLHEILFEKDPARKQAVDSIIDFFEFKKTHKSQKQ